MSHFPAPKEASRHHRARPSRRHGRRPRGFDPRVPHASALRLRRHGAALRPIPRAVSYLERMPAELGMLLNDQLGDCSCAGIFHLLQVLIFNASGRLFIPADALALQLYEEACGYRPGDTATDQGGVLQDVLAYCMRTGIPMPDGSRNQLLGYVELDPRQPDDLKRAIAEGGAVYIGIQMPSAYADAYPGAVWDVTDSPIESGHCVILAGYDDAGVDVVSWGIRFRMTWAAFAAYCDEAYLVLDRVWIRASDDTPFGMTEADYEGLMQPLNQAA